ncbi:hypothetical protein LB550_00030 [Mesorhizobium sp. BR1-1-14]|nr:hypothetical protein [Mesorhizobium sp. BR1-1-14]
MLDIAARRSLKRAAQAVDAAVSFWPPAPLMLGCLPISLPSGAPVLTQYAAID